MSRHFERDFASDLLTLAAGGLAGTTGGGMTLALVFRLDRIDVDHQLISARTQAGAEVWGLIASGGVLFYSTGAGFRQCAPAAANTWYMYLVSKPTGVAQVRDHLCVMDIDEWTHADRGAPLGDGTGPVDHLRISDGTGGLRLDGFLAAGAVIPTVLASDTAAEALRPGLAAWLAAGPAALWRFSDDPVRDLAPNGAADQTGLMGTEIRLDVEPPEFSYELGGEPPEPEPPAVSGWYGLPSIRQEAAEIAREERARPPAACPNDGEPLISGAGGVLHCPFDGWQYPRDAATLASA